VGLAQGSVGGPAQRLAKEVALQTVTREVVPALRISAFTFTGATEH